MEVWKPIKDYEEDYEISDLGRIRSLTYRNGHGSFKRNPPIILIPHLKKRGSNPSKLEIRLWRAQKAIHKYIDSLVLKAFVGKSPRGFNQAVHKDADQLNCKLKNLFWGCQELYQKPPWSKIKTTGNPIKKIYSVKNLSPKQRGLQVLQNFE